MDHIITHWQEIVSLGIVAMTIVLMVRAELNNRKHKKDCSGCSLAEMKNRQRYTLRKL